MADFASLIYGTAQNVAQNTGAGAADGLAKGAALALEAEKIQQGKAVLMQKQKEVSAARWTQMVEAIQKGANMSDKKAQAQYQNEVLPRFRDALQLTKEFPTESLRFITASPDNAARLSTIQAQVQAGTISAEEGIALIQDLTRFIDVSPEVVAEETAKLAENAKTAINAKTQREAVAAANYRNERDIQTTGQKALATKAAASYDTYTAAGGHANHEKQLEATDAAIKALTNGTVQLGTLDKKIPWGGDEAVLTRTDPAAAELVASLRGAANLKAMVADPNPTEKQINMALSRMIDPRLSNQANINKLKAARASLVNDENDRIRLFKSQGFDVTGSQSRSPVQPESAQSPTPSGSSAGGLSLQSLDDPRVAQAIKQKLQANPANLPALAAKFGLTPAQLTRLLGGQ